MTWPIGETRVLEWWPLGEPLPRDAVLAQPRQVIGRHNHFNVLIQRQASKAAAPGRRHSTGKKGAAEQGTTDQHFAKSPGRRAGAGR